MYTDAMPADKELIQHQLAKSYDDFTLVISGVWEPEHEDTRVYAKPLFNTDEIFGLTGDEVQVTPRIIKRRRT